MSVSWAPDVIMGCLISGLLFDCSHNTTKKSTHDGIRKVVSSPLSAWHCSQPMEVE